MSVDHYENFPVASVLLPARLRPPVEAIYAFARSADDIADEGDAGADQRLASLQAYEAQLDRIDAGQSVESALFVRLAQMVAAHALPLQPMRDLLSAFRQDVVTVRYASYADLLDYCRRSANPVGALMLHLYGVSDASSLRQSDAVCSALQLINFWQDLSVDIPRGRHYLPRADCAVHGACQAELLALRSTPENVRLISDCARWARASMKIGAPLVHRLPGRAGWELRLVVQGGLRILDKVDALKGGSLHTRPRLHAWDWCVMLGRALVM